MLKNKDSCMRFVKKKFNNLFFFFNLFKWCDYGYLFYVYYSFPMVTGKTDFRRNFGNSTTLMTAIGGTDGSARTPLPFRRAVASKRLEKDGCREQHKGTKAPTDQKVLFRRSNRSEWTRGVHGSAALGDRARWAPRRAYAAGHWSRALVDQVPTSRAPWCARSLDQSVLARH
jgi:hypothetical protein